METTVSKCQQWAALLNQATHTRHHFIGLPTASSSSQSAVLCS